MRIWSSEVIESNRKGSSLWRDLRLTARQLALGVVLSGAVGCAAGTDTVSLSGSLYNYDERGIASVRVNGRGVSGWAHGAEPGAVKSGGQTCCFPMELGATAATVEIEYLDGGEVSLLAEVEQPWPPLTSLALIHVLPGREAPRVVIEITPGQRFPRSDLMLEALNQAGLEPRAEHRGPLRDGPFQYAGD